MPIVGEQRLKFKKGAQTAFILAVKECLGLDWNNFAQLIGVHRRTLQDWSKERYNMPRSVAQKASKKSNITIPSSSLVYKWGSHLEEASRKGGCRTWDIYGKIGGNPEVRKQKWREWWESKGRFQKHPIIRATKPLPHPKFSVELAEYAGIIMGDGGISKRQVVVTLHKVDDKEYGDFVASLITDLFKVPVSKYIRKRVQAFDLVVSRTELVRFCVEKIGLKQGNKIKHQIDIPLWIKKNKQYSIACLRGLVDTDGSVFTHTYKVAGKLYSYKKLEFTSRSKPLLKSAASIFESNGIKVRFTNRYDIRIDSKKGMEQYMHCIGSHNPKHLRRYAV